MQNNVCSYLVSLRQERGGGVQEKIVVSKVINLSKCLTPGFLSFNVAFRIVDTIAPFPKFGDNVSQKSCRYAVRVFVLFFCNVGSGFEKWRESVFLGEKRQKWARSSFWPYFGFFLGQKSAFSPTFSRFFGTFRNHF